MRQREPEVQDDAWMLKQVQHDVSGEDGDWIEESEGDERGADDWHDQPNPAAPTGPHRWSRSVQRTFCEALARCGNVDQACRAVGKGRTGAYALRHQPHGRAFAIA